MKQIKLAIERFWMEPGNFEMWCEMLSRIPQETTARNMKELAKLYLDKDVDCNDAKLDRSKELYGLMGYNYLAGTETFEIKGVQFIERCDGYLRLTQAALELVKAYRENDDWEKRLATQLLGFSPRTRTIMHLLLNEGFLETQGLPLDALGKWRIVFAGESYLPFASNPEHNDMNRLLNRFKVQALGPLWARIIADHNVVLESDWLFTGSTGPEPALNNLTAFMRCPMQLFHYLEWFVARVDGTVILNREKLISDVDITSLFGVEFKEEQPELLWLQQEIAQHADYRGLIPVEMILERLLVKYYPDWDRGLPQFIDYYLNKGIKEGLFSIADHESGQPRHGRGYLGKREYQLIKLDVRQGE